MKMRVCGTVLISMLLTGCGDLISVEAVGTRDNSVFDPALVGAWNAGDALVIVRAGEDKSYRIHWVSAAFHAPTSAGSKTELSLVPTASTVSPRTPSAAWK